MQLEEQKFQHEKTLEYLGELLASIHNNGHPYDGKKAMERKDFIRLSYDKEEKFINQMTPEAMQAMMERANEALAPLINKLNE